MTTQFDNKSADTSTKTSLYEMAKGAAIVGGVFSIIVFVLLVVNYLQIKLLDPLRTERLETLKIKLLEQPKNEQLLSQIRELDLQIRKDKIRRHDFSQKGSMFLFGAVAVFLIGIKAAKTFKKRLPSIGLCADLQAQQVSQAVRARRVMTAGLALLAAAALFFISTDKVDFSQAGVSYPSNEEIAKNWPTFRGPQESGFSVYSNIPDKWDGKSGEAIKWKSEIPLPGHNSPVVWDNRVFISGANKKQRQVYCFDADSGELLWQADVAGNQSSGNELEIDAGTSYAAPTLATDGSRICAIFPTGDVGCFDFEGKELWSRNLGQPESIYGYASSLAIYQNLLFIQYDQAMADDDKSRMFALDTFSGMPVWETKRPVSASWASPIVAKIGEQSQLITCGDPWVIAYNPLNGTELWRLDCLGGTDVAPSPIYAGGLVFAIEPYSKLIAIKPTGRGDVTDTHIAWEADDSGPDICSPVSDGELIFTLESQGFLTCYKVTDGTKLWEKDLEVNFMSSPSIVGDRLYLLSEKGVMFIIKIGVEYKELAKCELGENCVATPAFKDGRVYIRAAKNLYCISSEN